MKIAIIRLSALGDIIQGALVLQFIKKLKKNIQIHWFVDTRFAPLLQDHPLIDRLYELPLKERKIKQCFYILIRARKNQYDAVIDLQGLIKSALVARFLSPKTFGFDKHGLRESFASYFYHQKLSMSYNENVYIRYLCLVHFALNEDFHDRQLYDKQPIFSIDYCLKNALNQRIQLDQGKKNILMHLGSSQNNKIYPIAKMALLCKMLLSTYEDLCIYLCWGNKSEYYLCEELLRKCNTLRIIRLPKLDLKELLCLTSSVDLIIGNDSGPTHLAFALNQASITIFGPTWDDRVCIQTDKNKSISARKKFSLDRKFKFDRKDFCIQSIDEKDIFELACTLLEKK